MRWRDFPAGRAASQSSGKVKTMTFPEGFSVHCASVTDLGNLRTNQEDRSLCGSRIFAVADGMGGLSEGEFASQAAVDALANLDRIIKSKRMTTAEARPLIRRALKEASDTITKKMGDTLFVLRGRNYQKRMAGTTAVGALLADSVAGPAWLTFNVGDSRLYEFRWETRPASGTLRRVSHDHSLVQEMVDGGLLTDDEARDHPRRNIVTRALGTVISRRADLRTIPARPTSILMACSDGLSDEVDDADIAALIAEALEARWDEDPSGALELAALELKDAALAAGGRDNITIVVAGISVQSSTEAAGGAKGLT